MCVLGVKIHGWCWQPFENDICVEPGRKTSKIGGFIILVYWPMVELKHL